MKAAILIFVTLVTLVFGSPTFRHTPSASLLSHVDSNVSLVLDQALSQLSDALFSNNKRMTKQMKVQMDSLKANLMNRLSSDLASLSSEFMAERENQGELTPQEKMSFSDKLHEKWAVTLRKEVSDWRRNGLKNWLVKVKGFWHGIESSVSKKVQKLKNYVKKRHHVKGDDKETEGLLCPVVNTWAPFESTEDYEIDSDLSQDNELIKRGFVDGVQDFLEIIGAAIFWVIIVPLSFLFQYIVLVVSVILTIDIIALFG